jgi:hypothetical protein
MQVLADGLVVESGYSALTKPPFGTNWVMPGNSTVARDENALEMQIPGSICIGTVFLTDFPKTPVVKQYDYIVLQGYPAGKKTYSPIERVEKTVRRFSGGLETAVRLTLEAGEK